MHPAASIIVFTTLSGLGYGLAIVLGLGFLDPSLLSTKIAYLTSLALIGIGLLSSLLHLGNPQRAWRALSQWRSSWLSREGVMAIATFVPLTLECGARDFRRQARCGSGSDQRSRVARDGLLHFDDLCIAQDRRILAYETDATVLPAVFTGGWISARKRLRGWKRVGRGVAGAAVCASGA